MNYYKDQQLEMRMQYKNILTKQTACGVGWGCREKAQEKKKQHLRDKKCCGSGGAGREFSMGYKQAWIKKTKKTFTTLLCKASCDIALYKINATERGFSS